MPITEDDAALGAVYFEFTAIGHSLKVVAIHGADRPRSQRRCSCLRCPR